MKTVNYTSISAAVDFIEANSDEDESENSKILVKALLDLKKNCQKNESDKRELFEALEILMEEAERVAMFVPSNEWTEEFRDKWNANILIAEKAIDKTKI